MSFVKVAGLATVSSNSETIRHAINFVTDDDGGYDLVTFLEAIPLLRAVNDIDNIIEFQATLVTNLYSW